MSAREQTYQRKKWRTKWRERQAMKNRTGSTNCTEAEESFPVTPIVSRQKTRGRQLVRRDRAAAYRHIAALKQRLHKAHQTIFKLRKRAQRSKVITKAATSNITELVMMPSKLVKKKPWSLQEKRRKHCFCTIV